MADPNEVYPVIWEVNDFSDLSERVSATSGIGGEKETRRERVRMY